MKLEIGKRYVDCEGSVYMVLGPSGDPDHPFSVFDYTTEGVETYTEDGRFSVFSDSMDLDIVAEYKEPEKRVAYFNVCPHNEKTLFVAYPSREEAELRGRRDNSTACVRVEWTDGQFDE